MNGERYEDFLGPLPQFATDPRQAGFLGTVSPSGGPKKARFDQRLGKVEIANVGRGWPASAPNLGFLQIGMERLIELGKLDPRSKKEMTQFVNWAVQRVSRLSISPESKSGITVNFWTRDDLGVFSYCFPVSFDPEKLSD